jgi:hypothetical protein
LNQLISGISAKADVGDVSKIGANKKVDEDSCCDKVESKLDNNSMMDDDEEEESKEGKNED